MGLTNKSTGLYAFLEDLERDDPIKSHGVIALAGNPNTGKSTVFNALTGLNQHTGNWPGKTVVLAKGTYQHREKRMLLVDLPGTYSLLVNSAEEQVARDFICFGRPDATVVVADATCLERNLNLILQVMEITPRVILCLNLMDEARRKKIGIDVEGLEDLLGIRVVATAARQRYGLEELKEAIHHMVFNERPTSPRRVKYDDDIEKAITALEEGISQLLNGQISSRWVALRLLDGDLGIIDELKKYMETSVMGGLNICLPPETLRL